MKNILIIKCGETFSGIKEKYGDFEDWIIEQSNLPKKVFKIYNLPEGDQLRHPREFYKTENSTSAKTRVKNKYEIKNQLIVPNFIDICLKF